MTVVMHRFHAGSRLVLRLLTGASFLAAVPAMAQTAAPEQQAAAADASSTAAIGDIVVTANRRSETVQRSSLVVDAFSGDTLRTQGINQATDLGRLSQGLQVNTINGISQIYIRGIGDASSNTLASPGVSFSVDGVYVARPEGVGVTFYDVSRVEYSATITVTDRRRL